MLTKIQEDDKRYMELLEFFRPPIIPVKVFCDDKYFVTTTKEISKFDNHPKLQKLVHRSFRFTSIGHFIGHDEEKNCLVIYKYVFDQESFDASWKLFARIYIDGNQDEVAVKYSLATAWGLDDTEYINVESQAYSVYSIEKELIVDKGLILEDGLDKKYMGMLANFVDRVIKWRDDISPPQNSLEKGVNEWKYKW